MKKFILSTIAAALALTASAVPAKRGPYPAVTVDGKEIMVLRLGDEHGSWFTDLDGNLMLETDKGFAFADFNADGSLTETSAPVKLTRATANNARRARARRNAPQLGRFPGSAFPSSGKQKALVVLVEFQDKKFKLGDKAHDYFSNMLNQKGFSEYNGTGCANEYFLEMSGGKFDCQFDVYGPVTLKNNAKYYGENKSTDRGSDRYPHEMIIEACQQLDDQIDFTEYDRDNDGAIDNVFAFYAGEGEASAYPSQPDLIWPHAYYVTYFGKYEFDGVLLDSYGCTNEWQTVYNQSGQLVDEYPDGVGTFIHEFSHILGLPDLYLTDEDELTSTEIKEETIYFTPGEWSVLDYGPYNNSGRTPPAYSAFERNALGWMTPEELTAETENPHLTDIQASNHAYCISNAKNSTEFYLLESRKRTGWDTYLPYDGMLVWHIDYDSDRWDYNTVNNKSAHQYVDLIEADGIANKIFRNGGDCFPGTKKVTSLAPRWWNSTSTGIKLTDITLESDKSVTFSIENPADNPSGDFMTVNNVINASMDNSDATVRGYIVGYVMSGSWTHKGVHFETSGAVNTNIMLADSKDETNYLNCIPVQLEKNSDARNDLNLMNNPSMLGRQVELYGKLTTYMGTSALKNVSEYMLISDEAENPGDNNGEETSIGEVNGADQAPAVIYDLQGRRVDTPRHGGIYIINGKTVKY